MKQMSLVAAAGFSRNGRVTKRATFLAEMDRIVPWSALCAVVEPFYPKAGNGRPPIALERMLRMYFLATGSTWPTLLWKKRSTTPRPCASFWTSI